MTDGEQAILRAAEIIRADADAHEVLPVSDALVAEAQSRLGVEFPPSYRAYVSSFGSGEHHNYEVYGPTPDLDVEIIPNVVWLNQKARQDTGLPAEWLIVMELDDSSAIALRLDGGEEATVWQIWPGEGEDLVQGQVAPDFGHFLLALVESGRVNV